MKLIKEAQATKEQTELLIETCKQLNVGRTLMESLDGVLQQYVQRINSGQMQNLDYEDISPLANIFAFASMMGVLEVPDLDVNGANAILNLYKRARPGNLGAVADQIFDTVDHMDPSLQAKFKQLANAWGRSLSLTIQNPTPAALKSISNRLLGAVHKMAPVIQRLEAHHGEDIFKKKVRGGILSRQLGMGPA